MKFFCDKYTPDLVFLSEPQTFQCDITLLTRPFRGKYSVLLNSEETNHPELALETTKAHGGTLIMWKSELDPFVTPLPTDSPAFLPILLQPPGYSPSIHIALYLPTSGKDPEFVSSLSQLDTFIEDISSIHDCPIFIRGDANCNPRNLHRTSLLKHFCSKNKLTSIDFGHPSHHHFTGGGISDTQLDVLLYQQCAAPPESLTNVVCSLEHPLVDSAHDLIVSSCSIPPRKSIPQDISENISAPRVNNDRVKIKWDDENLPFYQELLGDNLARLRDTWSDSNSTAAVSLLLQSTNDVLRTAATASNKTVQLGREYCPKPVEDKDVSAAQATLLRLSRLVRNMSSSKTHSEAQLLDAKQAVSAARAACKRAVNASTQKLCSDRDNLVNSVLDSNPGGLFTAVKSFKSSSSSKIQSLKVGKKVYLGKTVPDGFFDSLSSLKSPDMTTIHSSPSYQATLSDYNTIRKICNAGLKIPPISPREATEILFSLKPDVNDLYSITARHYINAGMEGARHFSHLMNMVIQNVNLFSLPELNSVWAMVLHKGHNKPKDSDRSYRTISTCPLLSKSLDKYIGGLYESGWAAVHAETQFQGTGSSHELAALLLTETIQHSLSTTKNPLFVIMLDAKSAFDKILVEFIIRNAFLAGSRGHGLLYLADRLSNRQTFVEWDKSLMGPILDRLGVEQGGCLSDRLYKLTNNEQLTVAQQSQLGLEINGIVSYWPSR